MSAFTIVLEVEDRKAFAKECNRLVHALHSGEVSNGAKVLGVGWGDRMDQYEKLCEFLRRNGYQINEIEGDVK